MNVKRKSSAKHIYAEREKLMHTSHWDMDYLSMAEIDALYRQQPQLKQTSQRPRSAQRSLSRRQAGVLLIVVGLALMAVGVGLGRLF
jgi:hypothetical protein